MTSPYYVSPMAARLPQYRGLRIGSFILSTFAGLCYISAVISLAVLAMHARSGLQQSEGLKLVSGAFASSVLGGILHAFGGACIALRDIARNSFR